MFSNDIKTSCVLNQAEIGLNAPALDPDIIQTEADLLAAAIHIDRNLMDAMNRLDNDFSEIHTLAMLTFKQLNSNKHRLNDIVLKKNGVLSEGISTNLDKLTSYNEQIENRAETPVARLQKLCASCDRSITFYRDIVESTTDKAVLQLAQDLVCSALERIRILKQALAEDCGCTVSVQA